MIIICWYHYWHVNTLHLTSLAREKRISISFPRSQARWLLCMPRDRFRPSPRQPNAQKLHPQSLAGASAGNQMCSYWTWCWVAFMTETKFLWVFTSRIIYLTKTNMHNLFLLLCFFLFFVLVTDKHETCSCWIKIIILAVENFFLIQNMSYSLWCRWKRSTEASWKVAIKQTNWRG